jgi:hypothetical protein
MNYWPSLPCNLSECQEPLFDFIGSLSVNGAKTSKVSPLHTRMSLKTVCSLCCTCISVSILFSYLLRIWNTIPQGVHKELRMEVNISPWSFVDSKQHMTVIQLQRVHTRPLRHMMHTQPLGRKQHSLKRKADHLYPCCVNCRYMGKLH